MKSCMQVEDLLEEKTKRKANYPWSDVEDNHDLYEISFCHHCWRILQLALRHATIEGHFEWALGMHHACAPLVVFDRPIAW